MEYFVHLIIMCFIILMKTWLIMMTSFVIKYHVTTSQCHVTSQVTTLLWPKFNVLCGSLLWLNTYNYSTGWAKDGQSSHLIKPSLYSMTVKFRQVRHKTWVQNKIKTKQRNQKCAQFKVNNQKHLRNHIIHKSWVSIQQAVLIFTW